MFVPAPNWISKFVGVVNLVTNLRGTFLSWSKNGTLVWSAEKLGLLILVLLIVSYIISCPKYGTSYQVFPSLSTISNIPIIFESAIVTVGYFVTVPNENDVVLISADIAFLVFFKRK